MDTDSFLATLGRVQLAVSRASGRETAATATVQALRAEAPHHRVSVLHLDRGRERAAILAESTRSSGDGNGGSRTGRTLPLRVITLDRVVGTGQTYVEPALTDENASGPLAKMLLEDGVGSYAVVPLLAGKTLVGTLNIGAYSPTALSEDLVRLAELLAPVLALALSESPAASREREMQLRYRSFFEGTPIGLYRVDGHGVIQEANPMFVQLLGYDHAGQLIGRQMRNLWVDEEIAALVDERLHRVGVVRRVEGRMRRSDGEVIWVTNSARAVVDEDGELRHYEGSLEDVTERRRTDERLAESEERFRALVQNSTDVIIVIDAEARLTYASPAVEDVLGYSPEEVLDRNLFRFLHRDDRRAALSELRRLATPGETRATTEVRVRKADGSYRYFEARATNLLDDPVLQGVIINARDVTERRLAEDRLMHDALHDSLTGLPNRAFFMDRLEHALEFSRRRDDYAFAVIYLDFDRFKVINDSLGHSIGDELLITAGRRLSTCIRQVDTLARLGGDEFAILLDGITGTQDATRIAERIHYALAAPMVMDGHDVVTTASIGIAMGRSTYAGPAEIIRDADIAMYRAKALGPGKHVVFDSTMHETAVAQLRLESDLRRAVERDEFEIFYQPIISLLSNELTGFEALMRWRHPTDGLLEPSEFIPAAEETGLIVLLGRRVLQEATRHVAAWQREFDRRERLSVSVNLSSRQFHHPDLVDDVLRALQLSGLAADCLHLEITEQVIMEDPESATHTFLRLKDLGVHLDIDDFGTGYSSLSMLSHFPVDVLKTDRSFISGMELDDGDREIVRAVFSLARSLGLRVVAEGVETPAQLAQLRTMGCQFAQGFFFAKPLAPEEARSLLDRPLTASA